MGLGLVLITLGFCRVSEREQTNSAVITAGIVSISIDLLVAALVFHFAGRAPGILGLFT